MADSRMISLGNGELRAWLDEDENFHIRAVDRFGDPVELAEHELDELIFELQRLRNLITK